MRTHRRTDWCMDREEGSNPVSETKVCRRGNGARPWPVGSSGVVRSSGGTSRSSWGRVGRGGGCCDSRYTVAGRRSGSGSGSGGGSGEATRHAPTGCGSRGGGGRYGGGTGGRGGTDTSHCRSFRSGRSSHDCCSTHGWSSEAFPTRRRMSSGSR